MFITVKKCSIVAMCVLMLSFVALSLIVGYSGSAEVFFAVSNRLVPVYGVETSEKVVALTFDAAWGADKTEGIMDILESNDCEGTFFLVGFWIDKYEDMVKEISNRGFDIGNHSNNHLHMPKLPNGQMTSEISSVNDRLVQLTGKKPTYFRAPFGDYNNKLMETLGGLNMVGVQWSVDSLDWKGLSGKEISDRVLSRVKGGDIVLFHNNSDHILDALPIILIALKNRGFKCVRLSDLVATENYTIDNNGIQHQNKNQQKTIEEGENL